VKSQLILRMNSLLVLMQALGQWWYLYLPVAQGCASSMTTIFFRNGGCMSYVWWFAEIVVHMHNAWDIDWTMRKTSWTSILTDETRPRCASCVIWGTLMSNGTKLNEKISQPRLQHVQLMVKLAWKINKSRSSCSVYRLWLAFLIAIEHSRPAQGRFGPRQLFRGSSADHL
jgi:hypothetical protein